MSQPLVPVLVQFTAWWIVTVRQTFGYFWDLRPRTNHASHEWFTKTNIIAGTKNPFRRIIDIIAGMTTAILDKWLTTLKSTKNAESYGIICNNYIPESWTTLEFEGLSNNLSFCWENLVFLERAVLFIMIKFPKMMASNKVQTSPIIPEHTNDDAFQQALSSESSHVIP